MVLLRKAQKKDVGAVHEIEREQGLHQRKKEFLESELTNDLAWFYVAENKDNGEIVGFIIFWIIGETMELHDIAIRGTSKRKGTGSKLMDFMLETARQQEVEEIFLEVRVSNKEAISFYKKYDFKQAGTRKNYYKDPVEDALVFVLSFNS